MSRLRVRNGTILQSRMQELKQECISGRIDRATMIDACGGFPWLADYILLSVLNGLGYDRMVNLPPCCRNTFYSYRRQFFVNLDCISKKNTVED